MDFDRFGPGVYVKMRLCILAICLARGDALAQESRAVAVESRSTFSVRYQKPPAGVIGDDDVARAIDADEAPWSVVEDRTGIVFILIPGGRIELGSEIATAPTEYSSPRRMVAIPSFYIAMLELSLLEVRRGTSSNELRHWGRVPVHLNDAAHELNWKAAALYCERNCMRLPTEDEWEFACGSQGEGIDKSRLSEIGVNRNAVGFRHVRDYVWPRATKKANKFGLFDVIGNLSEWVAGDAGPVVAGARLRTCDGDRLDVPDGRSGLRTPRTGSLLRMAKGGSWQTKLEYLSAARRAIIVQEWQGPITDSRGVSLLAGTHETGLCTGVRPAVDRGVVLAALRRE
jgi:formylglycine-generating enzyme required for sulfatase activity